MLRDDNTVQPGLFMADDKPSVAASPGILFVTLPKSGSIFVSRWLANGLGIREMKIAVCLFPNDLIIREKLDELVAGRAIAQQHVPPLDLNLRFIANRMKRLVVHVRDPRQATLSWVHHLDNFFAHKDIVPACTFGLEAVSPPLPGDYFDRSFEQKVDYQIEVHLPILVRWIQEWLGAQGLYGLEILYTAYEDFLADEKKFISGILTHFDIPPSCFEWQKVPDRSPENHYRLGKADEWRQTFTAEQILRTTSQIPDDLYESFGWRRL